MNTDEILEHVIARYGGISNAIMEYEKKFNSKCNDLRQLIALYSDRPEKSPTTILLERENAKKLFEDMSKRIDRVTLIPYEEIRNLHKKIRELTIL